MNFLPARLLSAKTPQIFSLDNTPIYDQMQAEIARRGRITVTAPPPAHAVLKRNVLAITSGDSSDFRS